MRYFVNSREMKFYDKNTTEFFFVPSIVLMERAAAAFLLKMKEKNLDFSRILVVCGNGNNGGDGLAIARMLKLEGFDADIVLTGNNSRYSEENHLQQKIVTSYGYELLKEIPRERTYTVVIDALFGVGLSREITGAYASLIEQMNQLTGKKTAVDIASGISADDGRILGSAFRADITITFAYAKAGMMLWPGNEYSGEVLVCDIGINEKSWMGNPPGILSIEDSDLSMLPERRAHSNKGTYGKLLVIAGSINMAGAAILCGRAAYAAGCGLVRILTPEENRTAVQTALPEAILTTYRDLGIEKEALTEALQWADALVCGPGIGKSESARLAVAHTLEHAKVPVLFDADALNLISEHTDILKDVKVPVAVTPHLGEMSRLTGLDVTEIQNRLVHTANSFTEQYHACCVLKDFRTVTCVPDGPVYLNLSGNHGMATAGSGDVLSGIIGSLMAQGMSVNEAAPLGVYLHGKAGDAAAERTGRRGLMASDIFEGIRLVLSRYEV